MGNQYYYDWFKGLDQSTRKSYMSACYPKWNADAWYQMLAYQIRIIYNRCHK